MVEAAPSDHARSVRGYRAKRASQLMDVFVDRPRKAALKADSAERGEAVRDVPAWLRRRDEKRHWTRCR